jgi:nitroimidazol reductase NimA-like FMN-containing flavoprotein (pyridoxamine 5'-phosphate oxidase superfamily)
MLALVVVFGTAREIENAETESKARGTVITPLDPQTVTS